MALPLGFICHNSRYSSEDFYETQNLGPDITAGQKFQCIVPAGSWFGVTVDEPKSFILAGCTVSPGFDFRDFEIADPS